MGSNPSRRPAGRLPENHPRVRYRRGLLPFRSKVGRPDYPLRVADWTLRVLGRHQKQLYPLMQKVVLAQERSRNAVARIRIENPSSRQKQQEYLKEALSAERAVLKAEQDYLHKAVEFDARFPGLHSSMVREATRKNLQKNIDRGVEHRLEVGHMGRKANKIVLKFQRDWADLRSQIVRDSALRDELVELESNHDLALELVNKLAPVYNARHAQIDRFFGEHSALFEQKYNMRVRLELNYSQVYSRLLYSNSALLGFWQRQARVHGAPKPFSRDVIVQYRDAVRLEHEYADFVQRLRRDLQHRPPF